MEGVSFTPTQQELARMGKTIPCNNCSLFQDFVKQGGSYLNMQEPNEKANIV